MGTHSDIDLGTWAQKVRNLAGNPTTGGFSTLVLGAEEPTAAGSLLRLATSVLVPWGEREGVMEVYSMALRPDIGSAHVNQRCMTLQQHPIVEGKYNVTTTPEERAAHQNLANRSFAVAYQQAMSEPLACVVYAVDPTGRPFDILHYHRLASPHWCLEQILAKLHLS